MRFAAETLVRGHAPDAVFAWWTDYGEPGHVETLSHGIGWSRRIVLEADGDVVVLREAVPLLGVPLLRHRILLDRARLRFREEAQDRWAAEWAFLADTAGTRIRREVDVSARLARLTPGGLTRALVQRDLDHHARDAERALAR